MSHQLLCRFMYNLNYAAFWAQFSFMEPWWFKIYSCHPPLNILYNFPKYVRYHFQCSHSKWRYRFVLESILKIFNRGDIASIYYHLLHYSLSCGCFVASGSSFHSALFLYTTFRRECIRVCAYVICMNEHRVHAKRGPSCVCVCIKSLLKCL